MSGESFQCLNQVLEFLYAVAGTGKKANSMMAPLMISIRFSIEKPRACTCEARSRLWSDLSVW